MNQQGVNSSININNLKNAFTFHVKCGEIYYLQAVNEVLIICNICNNENFDKYEDFLQHFSICYENTKRKDIDIDEFINRESRMDIKTSEISLNTIDVVQPQLSESDDDDDDDPDIVSNHNVEVLSDHLIPTIEIDDSDTESEKSNIKNHNKTNENFNTKDQTEEINNIENALCDEQNNEKIIVETNKANNTSKRQRVSKLNEVTNKNPAKSKESPKIKSKKSKNLKEKKISDVAMDSIDKTASFQNMMIEANKINPKADENQFMLNTSPLFSGILSQYSSDGNSSLPLLSNLINLSQFKNPKYIKSDIRPHQCSHCGKCFSQRINLVTHFRTHTGEKPYKCTMCNNAYPQKSNLDAHMLKHTGIRPHGCEDCGKRFFQISHLIAHERTHTGERPYKCSDCERTFSQLSHLKFHKRSTHSDGRLYSCSICKFQCTDQVELSKHHLTHLNESIQELNGFGRTLNTTNNSDNSLMPSFKEMIKNDQCSLNQNADTTIKKKKKVSFESQDKLNDIIDTPKNEDELQYNSEEQSNMKSPNKNINEDQIKRFECELCDKKFYQSNHLRMHQRTHFAKTKTESGRKLKFKLKHNTLGLKKKHECDDCGKKFSLVTEMKVHQRKKHAK